MHRKRLTNSLIAYRVTLLIQVGLRTLSIMNGRNDVPINILWDRNRYSHHPKTITHSSEYIHDNLCGQKLYPKHRYHYCGLILGEPLNQRSIQEYENQERDLLVFFYPTWLLSTYPCRSTSFPLSSGELGGVAYFKSP